MLASTDQRDDAIEPREGLHLVVDEEGLRDRCRVGHARCLDDDAVELELARRDALGQLVEHNDEILAHPVQGKARTCEWQGLPRNPAC